MRSPKRIRFSFQLDSLLHTYGLDNNDSYRRRVIASLYTRGICELKAFYSQEHTECALRQWDTHTHTHTRQALLHHETMNKSESLYIRPVERAPLAEARKGRCASPTYMLFDNVNERDTHTHTYIIVYTTEEEAHVKTLLFSLIYMSYIYRSSSAKSYFALYTRLIRNWFYFNKTWNLLFVQN